MDKLICSQKYVQILSDIIVQVAGSPTNISQLQKKQNIKVSIFKNFLKYSKGLQSQNGCWCYMPM